MPAAKCAEAVEEFEKALAIDPFQGRFWMYLSDAKEHLKVPAAEIERMRKLALEIEPDDYDLQLRYVAKGKEKTGG